MITKMEKLIPKLLFLTVVTTILVSGISFSKFESASQGIGEAAVAAFVVDGSGSGESLEVDCNAEMPAASYNLVVTNEKEGTVSEVSTKYDVVLEFDQALPSGMKISDGTQTLDTTPEKTTYIFEDVGEFAAGRKKQNTHTITITGSKEVSQNCSAVMSVYVDATQMD